MHKFIFRFVIVCTFRPHTGATSCDLSKVVLDLGLRQRLELSIRVARSHDTDLNVLSIQLTLEGVLQCQYSRVNGVLDVEVVREALLEETLCGGRTLAERGSLPAVEST